MIMITKQRAIMLVNGFVTASESKKKNERKTNIHNQLLEDRRYVYDYARMNKSDVLTDRGWGGSFSRTYIARNKSATKQS